MLIVLHLLFCIEIITGAKLINCPVKESFEKIIGFKPSKKDVGAVLHQDPHNAPITATCLSKCLSKEDCISFTLNYNTSSCLWYKNEIKSELEIVADSNVAWFYKTCYDVRNCRKSWIFERVPAAILIGSNAKTLPTLVTRRECQQACLNETQFDCKSAKFIIIQLGGGNTPETLGKCILSYTDRHLSPHSYRVSRADEEYFENQCSRVNADDFCSFETYDNMSLLHADELHLNKTKEECQSLCQNTTTYNCRGFSTVSIGEKYSFNCLVYSEDSKIYGPKLLNDLVGATYYEKARCLNISVGCSDAYMTINYHPDEDFSGMIYMEGYSSNPQCSAVGKKKRTVTLQIPFVNNHCGITEARNPLNWTLLSSTMILQYNSIVQTQADRRIRVGCIFGNNITVLIGTGVNFTGNYPSPGLTIVNSSAGFPKVEMRVVDLYTHEEVTDTQIGQELQLIIEVKPPPNESFDIWAGHLIAMTADGQESILLLDDRGCPTNLNVFPAFVKFSDDDSIQLVSTFQAFKFSSSPVIRFSVIVQFCSEQCPALDCGNYPGDRRKRSAPSSAVKMTNGTTIVNVDKEEFDARGKDVIKTVPPEVVIIVRSPKISSDKLIYGETNKVLIAEYDFYTRKVCLDYTLFIALLALWILIQIVFVATAIFVVRKYKTHYEKECVRESLEDLHNNFGLSFGNLDSRRVHFADNTAFT